MMRLQVKIVTSVMMVCLMGVFAQTATAQTNQDVLQKNKQAMDDYGNLEIDKALANLKEAEQICLNNNLAGSPLARTYVNMGMVEFGGNGDNALAMELFKKALCQDPSVMLDPLNSTPDMDILFKGAKSQVDSQGCPNKPTSPAGGGEPTVDDLLGGGTTPTPAGPPSTVTAVSAAEVVNDVLRHTPVTQQARLIPIPFFVQTNPEIEVASVVAFYRTVGERIFQQLPLVSKPSGWSAYIQCDVLTTLDPVAIEYYIAVTDAAGQLLSTAGSEAQPFTIQIGEAVSAPPPSIPGEEPMPACQEECPPWNPDCNNADCKQYADLCSEDEPCCAGMACVDAVCVEAEGGIGEGETLNTKGANTKVRFYVNGGIGFGFIPKESYDSSDFPNMRSERGVTTDKPGLALSKLHLRVGAMFALTEKFELGLNFRGDLPMFADFYDTLVPSVVANAAFRIAGTNAEKGFQMFGVVGFGFVQIMHRIPFKDCANYQPILDADNQPTGATECYNSEDPTVDWEDTASQQVMTSGFRKAGKLGAELGFDMNYWFVKNVGLNLGTIFDITFPHEFTINLDVQLGLALRF
ncbi:MAG: hypothetical protein JXX29_17305 [Deltaproteobacteria bacterium]|nr:hypothetical protein [Deltaproteobacteria bacterium]MBN2673443.1 hypothetical protein [Deltaproteobacteria bacterium]